MIRVIERRHHVIVNYVMQHLSAGHVFWIALYLGIATLSVIMLFTGPELGPVVPIANTRERAVASPPSVPITKNTIPVISDTVTTETMSPATEKNVEQLEELQDHLKSIQEQNVPHE